MSLSLSKTNLPHWKQEISSAEVRKMEPRECFCRDQFGYCWLDHDQWMFQAGEAGELPLGEPIKVELADVAFHHDEDDELH